MAILGRFFFGRGTRGESAPKMSFDSLVPIMAGRKTHKTPMLHNVSGKSSSIFSVSCTCWLLDCLSSFMFSCFSPSFGSCSETIPLCTITVRQGTPTPELRWCLLEISTPGEGMIRPQKHTCINTFLEVFGYLIRVTI